MADLKPVLANDPLRIGASDWNAILENTRRGRHNLLNVGAGLSAPDTTPGMLYVRNDTGAGIPTMNAVLGLDGVVFDPDGKPGTPIVFKGVTPDKTKHRGRFCILAAPVAMDKPVLAFVDDVAWVRLFVPFDEEDDRAQRADIDDGETRLRPATYGSAQILYREKPTEYGEMWAVVRLGQGPATFPVKLEQVGGSQGTSTAPASWTYDILDPSTQEELSASPQNPVSAPHKWQRPGAGQMIKATSGIARFDKDGSIVLLATNEVADQEPC